MQKFNAKPSIPATTVVIVTFNSSSTLQACLASLPSDCEVIIIDQQSSDDTCEIARSALPSATLLENTVNTGYSAGCNLGARHARGEVLIFLNPDAEFLSADGATRLACTTLNVNAMVAPRIFNKNFSETTLVRTWTTTTSKVLTLLKISRPRFGFIDVTSKDYVSGPCLAVSARNFWAVGGFDERFFLYREEETLARRLENISVPSYLYAHTMVSHVGAVSTSQIPEFSLRQSIRSDVLFFVIHFSIIEAAIISLVIILRLLAIALMLPVLRNLNPRIQNIRTIWLLRAIKEVYNGWLQIPVKAPQKHNGENFKINSVHPN